MEILLIISDPWDLAGTKFKAAADDGDLSASTSVSDVLSVRPLRGTTIGGQTTTLIKLASRHEDQTLSSIGRGERVGVNGVAQTGDRSGRAIRFIATAQPS